MAAGIDFSSLSELLKSVTDSVKKKIDSLRESGKSASISDMFDMQLEMNKLSQLSETSTSVASAMHQANMSMARNVK